MKTIEATGKTIEAAIRSGLLQLGKTEDEVDVEIITAPSSGFLGFGSKPGKVRLTVKEETVNPETAADTDRVENEIKETEDTAETAVEATEDYPAEEAALEAKAFLQEVLDKMKIPVIIEKMVKEDRIILHLHGENLGVLIGKHGQTLDALQYLTNLKTNQGHGSRHFVMLDVENYRRRREETLKQLALRLSGRVRRKNDKVVLEPMNGYERKIIHIALQDKAHIRTESEGQDPYRHVVIYYQE
ncbi:RNA-binding cell elongation regulator Jag/EloR [Megasphaera vaginalis (ex Bordigoni et al. 2020)]|uniref:RNA-binding cell elongation regulator Jag/EloR n=1 Tax=Megasphaera vaginalis (ex Bordigoni et al. 2020) TaxID=2045301 RepID=UPI000C7AD7E5|nr:RNA-binding cell elongation regulator Jag/EloR [Megasphaera vaginalis (ex Bordigoni et al. 2020)]